MIDKDTYGLEVEAKTNKAKNAFKDLANFIRNFGKKAEEDTKIIIDPNISKNELFKWREDLQKSIKEAKIDLRNFGATPTGHYYEENLKNYQEGLEAVDKRIEEIEQDEARANDEIEEMGTMGGKATSILSSLFDKSIGKIKRFTYYLLGARSVFSLFMKYQSIYYQYNEKMQYQSELSQNAIALSLAPAFEMLGNVITYASIGFAKFIELLTGVNVLSKVSTKGIRDYNKSLKESQSLLSGIDEITNLTLPSSTGLASQYQALDDFKKKIAEVEKWFKDNKWVKDLANGLKTIWEWLGDIIDKLGGVQNAFLLLGGVKVMSSIAKLLGTAGVAGVGGTGLLAIYAVLAGIFGYSAYKSKTTNTLQEDIDKLNAIVDTFNNGVDWAGYKQNLSDIEKVILPSITQKAKENKEEYAGQKEEIGKVLDKLQEITGIDFRSKLEKQFEYNPSDDEGFFKGIVQGAKDMVKGISDAIGKSDLEKSWENYQKKSKTIFDDVAKIAKNTVKDIVSSTNNALKNPFLLNLATKVKIDKTSVVNLANTVKAMAKVPLVGKAFEGVGDKILKAFGYAKGLDYVPFDNYPALLHKGEAIVPAKYNPTIHSEGNEYTNSLLEELVIKLDDLAKRPNVFEIDGQQFANATYGLYEEVNNNQNYVKGVVR